MRRARAARLAFALAAAATLAAPCAAQTRRLRFERLTVEQGLSNSWVLDILKDRRGFLWFATADGLNRYDGTRFVVYRHDPANPASLPWQRVVALMEDGAGRLWLAGSGSPSGLALYDRERDAFRLFPVGDARSPEARVSGVDLAEDGRGRIWLGSDAGLYRFDPTAERVDLGLRHDPREPASLSHDRVWRVKRARDGGLWVATSHGLDYVDPATGAVRRWPVRGNAADPLASATVTDLFEDEEGTLWAATVREGIVRVGRGAPVCYRPAPADPAGLSASVVYTLTGDRHGTLYVGTENGGLDILDTRTGRFTVYRNDTGDPDSPSADSIYSLLYDDDQGILWAGTFNGGVNYVSSGRQRFEVVRARRDGLSSPHVSSLLEDRDGNLWIGTNGAGIDRLDRRTGRWTRYVHDPSNPASLASNAVHALKEDAQGAIWVGTWAGGLQRLDRRSGRFEGFQPPHVPTALHQSVWVLGDDAEGRVLVGTQRLGVQVFDPIRRTFEPLRAIYPGLASDTPTQAIVRTADGDLWLGHDNAEHVDHRTGAVTYHRFEGAGGVIALHVDSRGNVWFGTRVGGLRCLPARGGAMRTFGAADGLPSVDVTSILEDANGNLWLGTSRGLVELERAVDVPAVPRLRCFEPVDGLQGYEFSRGVAVKSPGGELLFGGQGGLTIFRPERVGSNPHVPPVRLTGFRVLNRSADVGASGSPLAISITEAQKLVLSPSNSGIVTFEFAALDFIAPQKNQYRYRLEGFDRGWTSSGNRGSATYTNLPPGTYRFQVAAANNDGLWNAAGAQLTVVCLPRFYERGWFFAVLGLAVVGAGLAVHRSRIRQHVQLEHELQSRIAAARAEIGTLDGLLPICTGCKRVRDDQGYWGQIESYVSQRAQVDFSHGICPECHHRHFGDLRRAAGES